MTESASYKPRLVSDVLNSIMKIIPTSETILIEAMNDFKEDLRYRAPELQISYKCWDPFIKLLNTHIPNIKEDWQIKIQEILMPGHME
jgi:hypothetical protein